MNQQTNNTGQTKPEEKPKLTLKDFLTGENAMAQLRNYLGKNDAEIQKFVNSVLMTIATAKPTSNLQNCSFESVFNACIDAITLGLTIDNRNHAYLVAYWNDGIKKHEAKLQIGYKGYIYKIKQAKPDANFYVELVFEGDEFSDIESVNGLDSYKHIKHNPFKNDPMKLQGAYCYITYMVAGEQKGRLTIMGKEEIDKIKALAKSDIFWKNWYNEKAKVAVIRRASKIEFASIVEDLDTYDNENYISDSAEMVASKPASEGLLKLSNQMEEQNKMNITPKPKADDTPEPEPAIVPKKAEEPKKEMKQEQPKPAGLF